MPRSFRATDRSILRAAEAAHPSQSRLINRASHADRDGPAPKTEKVPNSAATFAREIRELSGRARGRNVRTARGRPPIDRGLHAWPITGRARGVN